MLAPVTAVLMTVIAFTDGTEPQVENTRVMTPVECIQQAAALTLRWAEEPPVSDHGVLAWSVTCQMERADARGPQ